MNYDARSPSGAGRVPRDHYQRFEELFAGGSAFRSGNPRRGIFSLRLVPLL